MLVSFGRRSLAAAVPENASNRTPPCTLQGTAARRPARRRAWPQFGAFGRSKKKKQVKRMFDLRKRMEPATGIEPATH